MRGAAERLVAAAWFGCGLALAVIAAPAAFGVLSAPSAAAVVGAMLARWHYVALAAPALLLAIEWRAHGLSRSTRVLLLAIALLGASAQIGADLAIRRMRITSPVAISSLPAGHPTRATFGRLHGVSMLLMLIQVAVAGGVVATRVERT